MNLSYDEAGLYYKLMWPLQFYTGRKLKILSNCPTVDAYQKLDAEHKLPVRDALFENIDFIDAFVKENPDHLNTEELAIIQSWRHFVRGDFYIERYLAKHAVFIKDETVYAVLGLLDSLDYIIPKQRLPIRVKTVLLPFKGQIIYDGLLQFYSIYFGGGIKSNLREIYLTAKQNGRIVDSLDPGVRRSEKEKTQKTAKDWSATVDKLAQEAQVLSAGSGTSVVQGAVFSLVKASLVMAQASVYDPEDIDQLREQAHKVERALKKIHATLNRASPGVW